MSVRTGRPQPGHRSGCPKRRWARIYRARMDRGAEKCRNCGRPQTPWNPLTFDHITPVTISGRPGLTFDNATILCLFCNHRKGPSIWPGLISLAAEEALMPPDRRPTAVTVGPRKSTADPERLEMAHDVLAVLVELHPDPVSHWDLAVTMGFERVGPESRIVLAGLRILKKRGLATPTDKAWLASDSALAGAVML